jgi:hypothetical protein
MRVPVPFRDEHLRADNVFATTRFPTLEFRNTAIVETPTGLDVTGTLRVRDISCTGHRPQSPGRCVLVRVKTAMSARVMRSGP